MWIRIKVRSPSNLSCGISKLLELIRQSNSRNRKQQAHDHTGRHVRCSRQPFAILKHLRGLPSEARKRCVAAEKSNGNRHAPVRRNHHPIQRKLSNQPEQKTSTQIDKQRAVGESSPDTHLHQALQPIARQRADSAEDRNQNQPQRSSTPPLEAKQKTPGAAWQPGVISSSICARAVMANAIAFLLTC